MLDGTSYISKLCQHEFYDWVMFRDEPIQYPDDNPVLGRYLGTEIDVGPAMRAEITKVNIKVVDLSKYCGLKKYKCNNQAHISLRKDINSNKKTGLGWTFHNIIFLM